MRMIDILTVMKPDIYPEDIKLHLATPGLSGKEPIDL